RGWRVIEQWFLINLLIFSPIQCENWLFGFAACINFLSLPCLVAAIVLLLRRGLSWMTLLLAAALAETASLSLANGLLGWVLIPPLFLLLETKNGRDRKWFFVAWGLLAAGGLILQFWGYRAHPWDSQYYRASAMARLQYFFAFL